MPLIYAERTSDRIQYFVLTVTVLTVLTVKTVKTVTVNTAAKYRNRDVSFGQWLKSTVECAGSRPKKITKKI